MSIKGFNNIGNTCYLNAGLQMLLHNKDLCNLILKNTSNQFLKEIGNFIIEYNSDNNTPITPILIKNFVTKKNNMFRNFNQHDASEFIIFMLDALNDALNGESNNISNNALNNTLNGESNNNLNNELIKLYEYTLNTTIKCKLKTCLNISNSNENNNFMIFDLKNTFFDLNDCYKDFIARVKLENESLYSCDNCKKYTIASMRKKIIKWPQHLIIILKRFEQNGHKLSKNSQEIKVPVIWEEYILKGIVFHSGSLYGGHYVYIGYYNEKWYLLDDSCTSEITNNEVFCNFKNYGYIYYFEKK
jgi:ubiquitin C-terminal hydrolase